MDTESYLNHYADLWVALAGIRTVRKGHPTTLNNLLEDDGFTSQREAAITSFSQGVRNAGILSFQYDVNTIKASLREIGQDYRYDTLLEIDAEGVDAAGTDPCNQKPVQLAGIKPGDNEFKNAIAAAWLRRSIGLEHVRLAIEVERYLGYHDEVQHAMVIGGLNGAVEANLNNISSLGFPVVDKQAAIGRITSHINGLGEFYNPALCQFGKPVSAAHGAEYEKAGTAAVSGRA